MAVVEIGMTEVPFFFPVDGQAVFAVLHRPQGDPSGLGFVFCHPFAEEKLWAHRVFVSLARDLAASGHAVLRFDHRGHGDSEGDFQGASVETHIRDIEAAVSRLRADIPGVNRVAMLGLRLGATFAALAAVRIPGIEALVLWDPVVNGGRYMQEVLRSNLTGQMASHGRVLQDRQALATLLQQGGVVNVDGYELGQALFEQVSAIDLLHDAGRVAGPVLVVQAGKPGQPARKELVALAERYADARLEVVAEEPFWREIKPFYQRAEELSRVTMDWLGGAHPAGESDHV